MGYEQARIEIVASVSRHNSDRDVEHNRLWTDLATRVRAIVDEPQFQAIIVDMWGTDFESDDA